MPSLRYFRYTAVVPGLSDAAVVLGFMVESLNVVP
jgi:hypothetical protein